MRKEKIPFWGKVLGMVFLSSFLLWDKGYSEIRSRRSPKLKPLEGVDVEAYKLESILIEGWERDVWQAYTKPGPPEGHVEVKIVPGRPKALAVDPTNKNCLGIRFIFTYPGNNQVVLLPPKDRVVRRYSGQLDENNRPVYYEVPGIELPGIIHAISVWVLGRGNDYTLEAWVEDYKGDVHVLKFGSINFIGWRPMVVEVPRYIPQSVDSYPQMKTLVLKRLVLRAGPRARQDPVVFFFDSLKVLSETFDVYFEGVDIDFDEEDRLYKNRLNIYRERLERRARGQETEERRAAPQRR